MALDSAGQLAGPHRRKARSQSQDRYLSRGIDTLIKKRSLGASLGATRADHLLDLWTGLNIL